MNAARCAICGQMFGHMYGCRRIKQLIKKGKGESK